MPIPKSAGSGRAICRRPHKPDERDVSALPPPVGPFRRFQHTPPLCRLLSGLLPTNIQDGKPPPTLSTSAWCSLILRESADIGFARIRSGIYSEKIPKLKHVFVAVNNQRPLRVRAARSPLYPPIFRRESHSQHEQTRSSNAAPRQPLHLTPK